MVDFKADERLNTLNHSCAHVMAQAVKHLYPHAKFWLLQQMYLPVRIMRQSLQML